MEEPVQKLRKLIKDYEKILGEAKDDLAQIVRDCNHQWSQPEPDHIYEKGYTTPGDPPGTMGVDWRGPVSVPSKIIKRWKRTCAICGQSQYTSETMREVIEHPKFDK